MAKALPTAFLRRFASRPRMLGVRFCLTNISGTKRIPASVASSLPISADWLKVRDHIRVQCKGTGMIMMSLRSLGKCRSSCFAIIRASPIFPPYFKRSATLADRLSYFTAALIPSCWGGFAIHDAHNASLPRSNSKGVAHPQHQGGPRNSSCCQQEAQNGPPAGVISPQHGQRSGSAQSNIGRKIWLPIAITVLSDKAQASTRYKWNA